MRTLLVTLFAASAVLASSVARADDSAPTVPPPPPAPATTAPPTTSWYGYQTLATDGLAVGIFSLSAASNGSSEVPLEAAVSVYGLAAPIVHIAHGHVGKGLGDLAMRAGMLALGVVVGYGVGWATFSPQQCSSSTQTLLGCMADGFAHVVVGMEIGGMIGVAGASTIDAVFLAHDSAPSATSDEAAPTQRQPASQSAISSVRPTFGVAPERTGGTRATLGLVGTF